MNTPHDTTLLRALEQLPLHDHLCSIYESSEEHFAVAIPFIRIGLDRGEKCIYIAWHATGKRLAPEEWASVRARVIGETSVNEVLDIEAFDGVRKIIQNSAVPIRDTNERITGAVVVNEDISARKTLVLEIEDRGHGIPEATLQHIKRGGSVLGVGIAGMSERIEELGGRLELKSGDQGTTVSARFPFGKDA